MFIIFFIISLLIYGLLVFYVGWSVYRGFRLNRVNKWLKITYIALLSFVSISFIFGRFGEGNLIIQTIGNYWLALFCILLLTLPIVHLVLLILRLTKYDRDRARIGATILVTVVTIGLFVYGVFQAYSSKITNYEVSVHKEGPGQINAVLITDTHFGFLSGKGHAKRMVEEINKLDADYIFISGDIIDDDLAIVQENGILDLLSNLKSEHGTYAVLGNHDRDVVGTQEIIRALESANMTLLYESYELMDEGLYIVGRKDLSEGERLNAEQLLMGLDKNKPIIVLDHQPTDLISLSEAGADITLSGHTHHGQIFPGNLVTERLFPNDYGLKHFSQMSSIVSSGYGFWGPPFRLGSRSEIVQFHINFQ